MARGSRFIPAMTLLHAAAAASAVLLSAAAAAPGAPAAASQSVERWIARTYPAERGEAFERRYALALADLDGDGRSEALVYLLGAEWCGSGGCTLAVLTPATDGWRLVSRASVVSAPIRILRTRHHGWLDLAVRPAGGGIRHAHEAVLRFDGRRYPGNPSILPPERGSPPPGTVAIRQGDRGLELRR